MTEPNGTHEHPGHRGWGGPGGPGFGPGRRFRRGALIALAIVVLLVAALATLVASAATGNAPSAWITILVSAVVVAGLIAAGRWFWRNARAIGGLMDAADRVAGGDYAVRVPDTGARQLGRLTTSFNEMAERLQTDEVRRRELLGDITHELRTPLQVLQGTIEGMLDGLYPIDPERLRPLIDETTVMARLLDDLRTLSMAEAGVLALHRETIDPRAAVEDVVRAFEPLGEEAGIALEAAVAPDVAAEVDADPVRLAEILANLVANALHHTPQGGRVTIGLSSGGDDAVFEVTDTGSGISADDLPFVFDRFMTSADTGGTGLGLTIAKGLVESHGGSIEASAAPAGGTTIRFIIPQGRRTA